MMEHGSDTIDRLRTAARSTAGADLAFLSRLIETSPQGRAAIDAVIEDAMGGLGADVEAFEYAPGEVPLVGEFATARAADCADQRCVVGHVRPDRKAAAAPVSGLILFAHPDTEAIEPEPGWSHDPYTATIDGGRLYGWGVADDLAGIATMIGAVRLLSAAGLHPAADLALVSAPSKKHRRGIAAALHRGLSAGAAIYLHPAESGRGLDEIKAFAPGQLEFVVTVEGGLPKTSEPAHTAFAHTAPNAIAGASAILEALLALDEKRARGLSHPRLQEAIGRSVNLMVSHLAAGAVDELSRMAAVCRIGGAMTLIPGEALASVMNEVEAVVRAALDTDRRLAGMRAGIDWRSGVSAAETRCEDPLYRNVEAVLKSLGAAPRVNPLHTSSDIRNPVVQAGIPTVGFGPLCGNLTMSGGVDEWIDINDFQRAIVATGAAVLETCGVLDA